jgi:hypothetical protein
MKKSSLVTFGLTLVVPVLLNSCDSPIGQGAAIGAGLGASAGGGHHGGHHALESAAAGAAVGALIGAAIEEEQAARYGPPPGHGYPLAQPAERPGFYFSPYTDRLYDLRAVPHGELTRDVDTGQLFRRP